MGKTVTTYLIDGDPKGTQYAFISNKICQMFVVPRSNLAYLNEQEKLQKPAFYILIGEDEATKPQAYIGETENFKERVKDHDSKKTFWQKALIFVSKDADMTKADVQYLEHKAIAEAKQTNAFVLNENKQTPKAPNLPEYQRDAMDEFFEDVKFLASFIGCNIFELTKFHAERLFYTKGRGCDAQGIYGSNGFTVLKGSVIAKTSVPSLKWDKKRTNIMHEYADFSEDKLVMTSDKTFASPSTASSFCLGRPSNGWADWKDKDGNTLDSVYRKQLEQCRYFVSMSNILYKYLDINGAKCMIGNQNLQFTNASQLNDPFDCHPKLIDYSNVPESKLQGSVSNSVSGVSLQTSQFCKYINLSVTSLAGMPANEDFFIRPGTGPCQDRFWAPASGMTSCPWPSFP